MLTDRVGSGRVGSSHPDPVRPMRNEPTREKPCIQQYSSNSQPYDSKYGWVRDKG